MKKSSIMAFTLAEVLITLAIIGVVSALVIPSVLKNYNDKKYNTARLKALHTFGDAGKMASINGEINGQPTARAFVENVLSKYLKIVKICDKAEDCGFPGEIQPLDTSVNKISSGNGIYVKTTDGFNAKIAYNPNCARNSREISQGPDEGASWAGCIYKECAARAEDQICLNVIYDMNGIKGPNHVGEDVGFVTTFWSGLNAISVAPGLLPYNIAKSIYDEGATTGDLAQTVCINHGNSKVQYTLPSVEELLSIMFNQKFIPMPYAGYWTGSFVADRPGFMWEVNINYSTRWHYRISNPRRVWCVRR